MIAIYQAFSNKCKLSLSSNKEFSCLIGKGDIGFLHLLFCLLFLLSFFLQNIYDAG